MGASSDHRLFAQSGDRAEDVGTLISYAREQLRIPEDHTWQLLSSLRKMDKTIFEIEETRPTGGRRLIGKVAGSEKSKRAFDILERLRAAGMRPPSMYCVVEPVAYLPERNLLLQERAGGSQMLDSIKSGESIGAHAVQAAEWLLALQDLNFPGLQEGTPGDFSRTRDELFFALPGHTRRLRPIIAYLESHLDAHAPSVASHGDYHPMNVFIDEDRVTAIDIDTFAAREPMYDVAYFLAQTAIMGYQAFQSFAPTEELRATFLETIAIRAPRRFRKERVRVHVAFAFLRSLHYDFCILRTKPHSIVEPFLSAAERALSEAHIRLAA